MHSPHPNNIDTMNEPNNTNNGYVRSFPEDFNFDNTNPPVHMPINLHAQNFPPIMSIQRLWILWTTEIPAIIQAIMHHMKVIPQFFIIPNRVTLTR